MLKLKASIGQSGNDEIEEDGVSCICLRLSELTERIGVLPILYRRYCCRGVCNEDVSWEVSTKTNVGFELSLFNALRLQADYFYERRKGIFCSTAVVTRLCRGIYHAVVQCRKDAESGNRCNARIRQKFR